MNRKYVVTTAFVSSVKAINPLKTVLEEASLSIEDLDEIVMVGGSSRIPKLREEVVRTHVSASQHRICKCRFKPVVMP